MKLDDIRRKIDKIDRELLVLLQERMGLAIQAKKFKAKVADPQREEVVLARAERMNLALVESSFARQLLSTIIQESKRLQKENRKLVAFQGEHGAYGEVASRRLSPGMAFIPCLEFIDVFTGVQEGHFDLGVVPVENSLEGAVTQVNDLLTTTDLKVIGEVKVPVNHCLLAPQLERDSGGLLPSPSPGPVQSLPTRAKDRTASLLRHGRCRQDAGPRKSPGCRGHCQCLVCRALRSQYRQPGHRGRCV